MAIQGRRLFVAWADFRNYNWDIFFSRPSLRQKRPAKNVRVDDFTGLERLNTDPAIVVDAILLGMLFAGAMGQASGQTLRGAAGTAVLDSRAAAAALVTAVRPAPDSTALEIASSFASGEGAGSGSGLTCSVALGTDQA